MTSDDKKVFFLAGEPSGDRIGADILRKLQAHGVVSPLGVGGPEMAAQGMRSLFSMSDLSVMGFSDVIKRLPLLLWRIRQTALRIVKEQPDAVVLIDSQVFSALLAKRLRSKGFKKPIILYVAPSVWAWKPERAPKLKPLFDEVLAVLPFEPEVMQRLDGPNTSYVGHPATDFTPEIGTGPQGSGLVALLPGSRSGEIKRHMPILNQLVDQLAGHEYVRGFILPTLPHLVDDITAMVAEWSAPVQVIAGREARDAMLDQVSVAVVTAGTITLELGLAGVPMIGTYMPDKRLMHHYEKAGRPMIALPNIVLGHRMIPEIVPDAEMVAALVAGTKDLLENEDARATQKVGFIELRALMEHGVPGIGRQDPADRILTYLD